MTTKTRVPRNGHVRLKALPPMTRKPVDLKMNAAVASILQQVVDQVAATEIVKVAISAFIEGRALEGEWALRITGAQLVPAPEIHEGVATAD